MVRSLFVPMAKDDELLDEILSDDATAGEAGGKDEVKEDAGDAVPAEVVVEEVEVPAHKPEAPQKRMDFGNAIGMLPEVFKAIGDIPNERPDRPENRLEPHAHLLLLFMVVIVLGAIIAVTGSYLGI
jgi:hypothetical protein